MIQDTRCGIWILDEEGEKKQGADFTKEYKEKQI